ncbi:hypothetical protein DFQ28_001390, partial [Apophysomyces sp. BC1034]
VSQLDIAMIPISQEKQDNIRSLTLQGFSIRKIAQRIGISRTTVSNYQKAMKDRPEKASGGRPPAFSEADCRVIARRIGTGEYHNATHAADLLAKEGKKTSPQTVRNLLKKREFKARPKPKALPPKVLKRKLQ